MFMDFLEHLNSQIYFLINLIKSNEVSYMCNEKN